MAIDNKALFNIGYGLYVLTSNDGRKDNGMICNTVMQVSADKIAVGINKANYTHDVVKQTGKVNVLCLTKDAPFSIFKEMGFQSGKTADKMRYQAYGRSQNGLAVIYRNVNAFLSLRVEGYIDLGTHGLFICSITESGVLSDAPSVTYADYHAYIKPKQPVKVAKGYKCKICGYVYEGEPLPSDFICPLCKHPASDFEKIN